MTLDFDTLLGGRVLHGQRNSGHRSGIEPVLLAAAIAHRDMAWRLVAVAVNYSLAAAAVAGRIHLLAHLNAH